MYPAPHNHQHRPSMHHPQGSQSGPAPASQTVTSKGTVITRYAPPPGYTGSSATGQLPGRPPFPAPIPTGHGYNPAAANYTPSPYGAPQNAYSSQPYGGQIPQPYPASAYYSQNGYPGYPPQPGYPSQPGYPPQPGYPSQPGYPPQAGLPPQPIYSQQAQYAPPAGYPNQPGYLHQQNYAATHQAQTPNIQPPATNQYAPPTRAPSTSTRRHSSISTAGVAPSVSKQNVYAGARVADPAKELAMAATRGFGHRRSKSDTVHPDQMNEYALSDPNDECCFIKRPGEESELPDKCLDIALVVYHPALPTNCPLPSTFREAELEALAPRKPKALDDAVSEYFTKEHVDAQLNSIRHSEDWEQIRDDPIFKELNLNLDKLITHSEMLKHYRVRLDPTWNTQANTDASAGAMDLSYDAPLSTTEQDPLYDLQQALSSHSRPASRASYRPASQASNRPLSQASNRPPSQNHHRRSNSVHSNASASSHHSRTSSRYRAIHPVRDSNQEDLLAQLGVTGSPKTVYETPGPAFGPPAGSSKNSSRQNSFSSASGGRMYYNPPIEEETSPANIGNHWSQQNGNKNGFHREGSTASRRTAFGSDFDGASDNEATPRPKAQQNDWPALDNRKRGHLEDEETPKQKRKQQRLSGVWDS